MDDGPDLSHLTEEERKIIQEVLNRQKVEENKEHQVQVQYEKELDEVERQINERKEVAARQVGTQDDAICQICQKTKFADGIGHKCYYCQLRSCARCGGRMQIKLKPEQKISLPNLTGRGSQNGQKTVWACSLCQKKQQILGKTGKWFHKDARSTTPTTLSPSTSPTPPFQTPAGSSGFRGSISQEFQQQHPPSTSSGPATPFTTAPRTSGSPRPDHTFIQRDFPADQGALGGSDGDRWSPTRSSRLNGNVPRSGVDDRTPAYDDASQEQLQRSSHFQNRRQQSLVRQSSLEKSSITDAYLPEQSYNSYERAKGFDTAPSRQDHHYESSRNHYERRRSLERSPRAYSDQNMYEHNQGQLPVNASSTDTPELGPCRSKDYDYESRI